MEAVVVKAKVRSDYGDCHAGAPSRRCRRCRAAISAAQISKGPDRDASEGGAAHSGITVIDDRFVIVRGLSQRYNNTWLNGLSVPSTETDSRAFSFDMIPSSQIDNLNRLQVAFARNCPGDFAGGFVKIVTKGMPDRNAFLGQLRNGISMSRNPVFGLPDQSGQLGPTTSALTAGKRQLQESFPHMQLLTDPDRITDITRKRIQYRLERAPPSRRCPTSVSPCRWPAVSPTGAARRSAPRRPSTTAIPIKGLRGSRNAR